MKRLLFVLIPVVGLVAFAALRRATPPEVPFTKAMRDTIVSTLTTNGKVEPVEFSAIRAEAAGAVDRIFVERGQHVTQGQILLQLDPATARAQLSGAEARIAQSRAELESVNKGGNAREIAQIESGLASARAQQTVARNEYESLRRLFEKKAATKAEVDGARQAVDKAQIEIESLERRRAALVTAPDRSAAQARLQEAESGAATARIAIGLTQMRSPMTGVLYSFDVKPGAYLNAGDLVGNVGRLNQLRVTVYVDEPELGRVSKGMPVTITWDALPGRQWKGTVERTPTQIVTLGTRQVGEVTCMIDNPDLTLIPGTNVNAEIRSNVVPHAVTIPKEALRRQGNQPGVYKLDTKYIRWQPVTVGVSSVTRIQITHGLAEGDAVALPVEAQLQNNQEVRPLYQ